MVVQSLGDRRVALSNGVLGFRTTGKGVVQLDPQELQTVLGLVEVDADLHILADLIGQGLVVNRRVLHLTAEGDHCGGDRHDSSHRKEDRVGGQG